MAGVMITPPPNPVKAPRKPAAAEISATSAVSSSTFKTRPPVPRYTRWYRHARLLQPRPRPYVRFEFGRSFGRNACATTANQHLGNGRPRWPADDCGSGHPIDFFRFFLGDHFLEVERATHGTLRRRALSAGVPQGRRHGGGDGGERAV